MALLAVSPAFAAGERTDSAAAWHATELPELMVATPRTRDVIPGQTLRGKELDALRNQSLADALRYFSGVQIKDYGGVGGIKTVNIRSMGTNHTGVSYDGIQLGNAQNGQTDLGQFSMDNMEAVSVYNGQRSRILQPARDFGNAGTVYLRTRRPDFSDGRSFHLRATMRAGSFDLLNPLALLEVRLSNSVTASLSAEWLNSSGKYKFRYRRVTPSGQTAYDTTATRRNGDINATRIEANVFGTLPHGSWQAKAYNYNSERGIPGAIVNNVWRRGERLNDNNAFVQGRFTYSVGRYTTMANAKYAFYRTHYVNNDDRLIHVDNLYRQKEFYVSSANMYEVTSWLSASLNYDLMYHRLHSDKAEFARPTRISSLAAAAAQAVWGPLDVQASVLWTYIHDSLKGAPSPADKQAFSPAVFLSVHPAPRYRDLQVRAFFKRSFRMPTFNDLYYTDMGNASLNPERVTQYNVGAVWAHRPRTWLDAIRLTADAYYNKVKDKIVAYPKGQQFRWTMLNLGVVDIRGIDFSGRATFRATRDLYLTLRLQYTYQRAIDVTDPADSYYRDQIPYIPLHSGSVVANATWRGLMLNYSWIYVGTRYSQQENILYNRMPPWYTSDLTVGYTFRISRTELTATLDVNNLLSQDYDVIVNYPMPKRNYKLTLTVKI